MFPIYMYVKEYKGLKDFEITFDNNYEITFEGEILTINKIKTDNNIENFYSIDKTIGNIDSVNLLIGKNGSGKTSVLEVLNVLHLGSSTNNEEVKKIKGYIILYKSYSNDEDFILEKDFCSMSIEIKEFPKKINVKEEFRKLRFTNQENYREDFLESIGIVKFSFKGETLNATQREGVFGFGQERTVFKLDTRLENKSKKNIYDYLIKIKQGKNKDNFENAYLTLVIPDLCIKHMISNERVINSKFEEFDKITFDKIIDDGLFRLYEYDDVNNYSLEDIILNNYFNWIYLIIILRKVFEIRNKKEYSEKKLRKMLEKERKKKLKLLDGKFTIKKFEILLKEIRKSLGIPEKEIIFDEKDEKNYKTVEEVAALINDITEKKDEINTRNDNKIIKKFKINFEEKNERIKELLEKYQNFHIPKDGIDTDLIFKSVEYIQIEEEGLSDGERIKLQYFSTLYGVLNGEFKNRKYITLLFDEVETYLHPEWSRRFLYELIEELGRYKDKKFKLIFATHSPFLIADVLAKDCIYLEKENGKIEAKIQNDLKTFGANIIDLFKNTMFLESTFGKFATEKIKGIVHKIEKAEKYSDIKHEVDFVIGEIGEKLISNKLKSMIESKFKNKYEEEKDEEYYRKKIEEYQAKLEKLGNKENNKNS